MIIKWYEKTVARLGPIRSRNVSDVRGAVAGILELRRQIAAKQKGKSKLNAHKVKSWIEEGRR